MTVNDSSPKGKLAEFIQRHSVYIMGVILGVFLLGINMYIGLSLVTLVLDEQSQPEFQGGLSLPVINEGDYNKAKQLYLDRQNAKPLSDKLPDPFRL